MSKKVKKELREWIVLLTVGGFIYIMGWHTFLIGKVQQLVLSTGIIQPSEVSEDIRASYDFSLVDLEGNVIPFNEFKEKTVFINFWATWCAPCVAEMPDIHNLYEEKGSEVNFVMISFDQDREKARRFIEKRAFDFPVYFLNSALPQSYDTHAIPTTYVLDKQGKVRVKNHGMAKYNTSSFKELLSEISSNQSDES